MQNFDEFAWYKRRGYPHFDVPITLEHAQFLVTSPDTIAKHAFLPLVKFEILSKRYKPNQHIVKPKHRPIMYASHRDAHVYSYYSQMLSVRYEKYLNGEGIRDEICAYRKSLGKCNIDFAFEAFDFVLKGDSKEILAVDVSGFFDSLCHVQLKERVCRVLGVDRLPPDWFAVFKSVTKYAYVEREKVWNALGVSRSQQRKYRKRIGEIETFRNVIRKSGLVKRNGESFGIPQGTPISAIMSNVYMIDFDRKITECANQRSAYYRRYSDDILLVCRGEDLDYFRELISSELRFSKLSAQTEKEQRSTIQRAEDGVRVEPPIQYLGFTFDGSRVLLRSSTLARQKCRAMSAVRSAFRAAQKAKSTRIRRTKLYSLYSHLPRKTSRDRSKSNRTRGNFYAYIRRCDRLLGGSECKRQVRKNWPLLNGAIHRMEERLRKLRDDKE